MPRIALQVEYKGTKYHGWEKQKSQIPTVQANLELALTKIANEPINTIVAGRTDAGVHSSGQVVHFDTNADRELSAWVRGTNSHLPHDISVVNSKIVDADFSARFSAVSRTYCYSIVNRPERISIEADIKYWVNKKIDAALMQEAANYLIGEHDFSAFRAASCQANTAFRNIHEIQISQNGDDISTVIVGNAFLHHTVRNIMGTLIEVGIGKKQAIWVSEVLASKNRANAGNTAPARGLSLIKVSYPENVLNF